MIRKKVPLTAAQKAHDSAIKNLRGAMHAEKPADILSGLLDILLATAKGVAEETPEYYSYFDLTSRYGVSRKTIETFGIPEHKFGGNVRFSRANVMTWEDEHLVAFAAPTVDTLKR